MRKNSKENDIQMKVRVKFQMKIDINKVTQND